MLVVSEDLGLDSDVCCIESRRLRSAPVSIYPAAIEGNRDSWCEQPVEGPIETRVTDVSPLCRVIESGKAWQDGLVGNSRIIESDGARKVPIAGNAVGVRRLDAHMRCGHND
jgi:hypothetical protein